MLAPWADICYFADAQWWKWHRKRQEFIDFKGQKCSIWASGNAIDDPAVHILRNSNEPNHGNGLSLDAEKLVTGGNSGYQSLNLAVLAGAKTIILLGYDAREPENGQPSHWFGDHPHKESLAAYPMYRKSFADGAAAIKAAGVRVINCNLDSAITQFEKMGIDEALRL